MLTYTKCRSFCVFFGAFKGETYPNTFPQQLTGRLIDDHDRHAGSMSGTGHQKGVRRNQEICLEPTAVRPQALEAHEPINQQT